MRTSTLHLLTLSTLLIPVAEADFQAAIVPAYAGSAAAQYAYWGGSPGSAFTGFSHAFGAPNLANDPASDLAATLMQFATGAIVTASGNIYGQGDTLTFEVRATVPHGARTVTFQLRTLGTPIAVQEARLALSDGASVVNGLAPQTQLLVRVPGGFVAEEWLLEWDVAGLPIEGTQLVLTFRAEGANCSFDDARLDVLHDGPLGQNACLANPNSSGAPAAISAHGDDVAQANGLLLRATSLPQHASGYFLASRMSGFAANPGGSQGNLCLGGLIGRFSNSVRSSGAAGRFELTLDLTAIPQSAVGTVAAVAGDTWHFQAWFRDANPTVTSNFTDATAVTLR